MVVTHKVEIPTKGQDDARDITGNVADAVTKSGLRSGIATVFVVGSTAGVTTIEFEPGAVADLNGVFEALLGPSLTVPFADAALALGTWQQIMLLEFDTRPRRREIVIQIIGA